MPGPLILVYYATKAYVLSLSEALAEEVCGTGVTVLAPGPTASDFQTSAGMTNSRLVRGRSLMGAAHVARKGVDAVNAWSFQAPPTASR